MHFSLTLLAVLTVSIALPSASAAKRRPLKPRQATASAQDYSTDYWFDQLIDHTNPSAGTFKQRYFFSDQYYAGQGAPITISTPGEQSADGFYTDLTGDSMMHAMMKVYGSAGVVLEHRYWGQSSPYDTLTAPNLEWLTVQQAIDDYKYFVENVKLPWANGTYTTTPDVTPWVNIGCSYPGLLVAYTAEQYPDLFAAGYATSAPVNADGDFWEYWEPIEEGMPKNCSSDLAAAVSYMDNLMTTGSQSDVTALKTKFGMESVANDDFGAALVWPINDWQDLQAVDYGQNGEAEFFKFCDAIETNTDGTQNMGDSGVGMPQALENWAATFKAWGPDANCPNTGGSCYNTNDPTSEMYTDTSVSDKWGRAWVWLLCTQLGWFQVGDPGNSSSIVSAQVTPEYFQRQCSYYFPLADGTQSSYNFSQDVNSINSQFKGWNVVGQNLFVVNGQYDPWRSASLSSQWAPYFTDTPTQEITLIPNAHHCWDFYLANGEVDANVLEVQKDGINQILGWLKNWYTAHPSVTQPAGMPSSIAGADVLSSSQVSAGEEDADEQSSGNVNNTQSELESKVDELLANKKLAIVSYILNAVLAILLIVVVVLLVLAKRKPKRISPSESSSILPKWSKSKEIGEGDQLGEYGSGGAAGGRGKYQALQDQTA